MVVAFNVVRVDAGGIDVDLHLRGGRLLFVPTEPAIETVEATVEPTVPQMLDAELENIQ